MENVNHIISVAARAATAGHELYSSVYDQMSHAERHELDLHILAGCSVGLTFKWEASGVQIRLGVLTGDDRNLSLLDLNFPRADVVPPGESSH